MEMEHSNRDDPAPPKPPSPSLETRALVKFYLDCAQALTVLVAIVATMFTYLSYMDTRTRELRKPTRKRSSRSI
jgi:hypothetical protein